MSGGFGRKGLGPGEEATNRAAGFGRAAPEQPAQDSLAAKRQAFLESERLRRAEGPQSARPAERISDQVGLSEYAEYYQPRRAAQPERSLAMAYVLWFILGQVSAHRFYLGRTESAFLQVAMFIASLVLLVTLSAYSFVGVLLFLIWAVWILGDVFFIHKIHRQDWQANRMDGAIFS